MTWAAIGRTAAIYPLGAAAERQVPTDCQVTVRMTTVQTSKQSSQVQPRLPGLAHRQPASTAATAIGITASQPLIQ